MGHKPFFLFLFFFLFFHPPPATGLNSLTFCRIIISPPVTSTILMVRLTGLLSSWHFLHEPRSSSRLKAPSLAGCIIRMQRRRHLSRASPLPFSPRKAPTLFLFFFLAFPHKPSRWPRNKTSLSVTDALFHSRRQLRRGRERCCCCGGGSAFITAIKSFARGGQRHVCLLLSLPTLICLSKSEGITKIN